MLKLSFNQIRKESHNNGVCNCACCACIEVILESTNDQTPSRLQEEVEDSSSQMPLDASPSHITIFLGPCVLVLCALKLCMCQVA